VLTNSRCGRPVGVMKPKVIGENRVEAVYRSVHDRLWRSLLSYTGDADLASDAEAEAFAQVLRRGDLVDDVGAWVWRSAFRIAAGLLAARSTSTRPSGVDGGAARVDGAAPADGSVAEFLGLLAGLSAQQRACVALRYVGEYSSAEIGEILGTSAGTVRVQLHRAHASLRQTIAEAEHA
jgi:RNA polymerase sigma factor (sigma-70 family)